MKDDIRIELAELSTQLHEQLKFYGEIGVKDIRSARALETSNDSSDGDAGAQTVEDESDWRDQAVASPKAVTEQVEMFAELAAERRKPNHSPSLPVLTPQDGSLEQIRQEIGDCTRCSLSEHRSNIVFGEGSPQAKLVFVGEGPGAEEDATGRPFVGRAGQLLDKIIEAIGLRREDVYICNIVKCRPPGNRTPERDEVATCEQFLFRQLAFIRPKVIVALGSPAFQCLLRTRESISSARGQFRDWNGVKVMPTFHPAYLLRSPDKKREVWEDMKKVKAFLETLPR